MATVNGSGELIKLTSFIQMLGIIDYGLNPKKLNNIFNVSTVGAFCRAYSRKYVVLVGSNPSTKSPDCSAFHPATKSRQFVDKWFEGTDYHLVYMNLVDKKTEGNKKLKISDIHIGHIQNKFKQYVKYEDCKIIGCGQTACTGLRKAKIEHFEMPHPSGLCRFWNDKEAAENKVKEMLEWIRT